MVKFFYSLCRILLVIFILILTINYISSNDAPYPWQIGFQDPASPGFTGISVLHDNILFFLTFIILSVFWFIFVIVYIFKNNLISAKYLNHATFGEIV